MAISEFDRARLENALSAFLYIKNHPGYDEETKDMLKNIQNIAYELGFNRGAEDAKKLRDTLKKLLAYLSDEDEEGLLEHVEIIGDARALLAKTGG